MGCIMHGRMQLHGCHATVDQQRVCSYKHVTMNCDAQFCVLHIHICEVVLRGAPAPHTPRSQRAAPVYAPAAHPTARNDPHETNS